MQIMQKQFWLMIDCSSMLTDVHVVKVSFYARISGRGRFRSCDKYGVTTFDPPWPNTPCCMQTPRLYLLYNRSYC